MKMTFNAKLDALIAAIEGGEVLTQKLDGEILDRPFALDPVLRAMLVEALKARRT